MRGLTLTVIIGIGVMGFLCSNSFAQEVTTPVSAPVPAAKFTVSARLELVEAARRAAVRCNDSESDSEVLVQLVPLYRGDYPAAAALGEVPPVVGTLAVKMYKQAAAETDSQVRAVKEEVTRDLLSAFTLAITRQSQLHVEGYAALVESASKLGAAEVEIVLIERFTDEANIDGLLNPSMWQALGWWWNQTW